MIQEYDVEPQIPNQDTAFNSEDVRLLSLFARLQALEREYSIMQGRVEELEHLYQEERNTNRRRFLDMDRRLREQFGAQLAPQDTLTSEDIDTEIGIYRRGMAFLDAEDYVQAREFFQRVVNEFPNGSKVPDAMYWLAELYRNVEPKDLEKSRQFFVQMITLYSDHARIPEAMAKLGMIYHELGNVTRALEYLDRVIAEYPDHDAARLADTYAQELR
ncbi:MAG: tetratricopeptide repeat protein [Gammaproteobacteria bacterium]|nr:tetratricopeptide repeat protein [Gammaproteobacteria bacterium]